ncbi:alpha-glucosidase [Bacillus sp. HMF5848]|uniref:alpha-glucosidase n=1 Tax=Bacillus sp. HMF5848 TaxID=2495421 RepID=UPI000F77779A|nr:alpha-glucosidase [Bacillus sp. HMF5848]RSK25714.1 alpha-glucosidase [Bacillus sp. HMF5848]
MELVKKGNSFSVYSNGVAVIEHRENSPFMYVGIGKETIKQHYGDFKINDKTIEKVPLKHVEFNGDLVTFSNCDYKVQLRMTVQDNRFVIDEIETDDNINRMFFVLNSRKDERFFGCGEQFSYLNLKGRNFPIWTSEPGVGRDRNTLITFQADQIGIGGGDYYTTNYPQPTFISDSKYIFHMDTSYYSDFDFSDDESTQICVWGKPNSICIESGTSFLNMIDIVTESFGTQPMLPDWLLDGVTIGMQGGTDVVYEKVKQAKQYGINVNAVWCQDWVGKKITSFGKRLFWKWEKSDEAYPEFERLLDDLAKDNIRFMAYINPYLLEGTDLFNYALEHEFFIKNSEGEAYIADFGEFFCGTMDFTNPEAMAWYKQIIKKNMIDLGISGWMADFGEYIPVDAVFYNGKTGREMHNEYPALWARCNYEAVEESGKLGEIVYFMRAGGVGNAKYCTLMWAGDQSVDFTIHDGVASTIPAAISLGLLGNGLTHFDIGGYTSLFGNVRTEELMLRSLEYAVFTPYMRTHEGNRPDENFQYDQSDNCLKQFAVFSHLRTKLLPYIKHVIEENATKGIGAIRPLFMHYDDEASLDIAYEYLFGRDLLVAPVYEANVTEWEVYLPEDEWIHLFSKQSYSGGTVTVPAELGNIPVFYRKDSSFRTLFDSITK